MISRRCPECDGSNTIYHFDKLQSYPGAEIIDWWTCNDCGTAFPNYDDDDDQQSDLETIQGHR